ncbi:hypothetical protein O3G_MSEX002657 [Manduca sexta]|uniref:Uncharacterized protein n=1 Tax=Manduca sexta TaxID=7130 RepID=A0A921YP92_MANSE|nr:hypothetical protein O3G_MSEX002657 [Manduca sexta]
MGSEQSSNKESQQNRRQQYEYVATGRQNSPGYSRPETASSMYERSRHPYSYAQEELPSNLERPSVLRRHRHQHGQHQLSDVPLPETEETEMTCTAVRHAATDSVWRYSAVPAGTARASAAASAARPAACADSSSPTPGTTPCRTLWHRLRCHALMLLTDARCR